jgi:hypothetical protein
MAKIWRRKHLANNGVMAWHQRNRNQQSKAAEIEENDESVAKKAKIIGEMKIAAKYHGKSMARKMAAASLSAK